MAGVWDAAHKAASAAVSIDEATFREELAKRGLTLASIKAGKDRTTCTLVDKKGETWTLNVTVEIGTNLVAGG